MSEREKQKPEEKVKIVIKYIAGEVSISGAAAEGGVDRKTLQRWVMQYEAEGAAAFLPGQAGAPIQSGIKAAGGTGVFVRKRKSGRAQQKIWVAE